MRLSLRFIIAILLSIFQSIAHAGPGNLFNVSATGTPANISITLCLNAAAQLSCQTYTVSATTLSIFTTIRSHTYPLAGIKINTPGYEAISGCDAIGNGFCQFSATNNSSSSIVISPTSTPFFLFGGYFYDGVHSHPLSYKSTDNGGSWTLPSPLLSLPPGGLNASIAESNCVGNNCLLIGGYYNGSAGLPVTYTSSNGGNSWSLSSSLPTLPVGGSGSALYDVSCHGATGLLCVTVGDYYDGSETLPLTYSSSDGGQTWSRQIPALPGGFTSGSLMGIFCDTTGTNCVGVGSVSSPTKALSYVTTNGGASWSVATTPATPGNPANSSVMADVSCNSQATSCTAVGYYYNGSVYLPMTYISTNGGNTWSISSSLPSLPVGATQAFLRSVICTSSGTNCIAVGYYYNGSINLPLTYITNNGGNSWSISSTLPPTISFPSNNSVILTSVKCNSWMSTCLAGGNRFTGSNASPTTFISFDSGNTWALTSSAPSTPLNAQSAYISTIES